VSPDTFIYSELEKRTVACPLCQGQGFEALATQDRYDMGITTVGCNGCGLVMTNPMPTPAALSDFYRRHYRTYYRKLDVPTPEYIREFGLDRRARYTSGCIAEAGLLRPSSRVLDVGCAEGSLLQEIRRRVPECGIVGVEPGEGFSKYSRETLGCKVVDSLDALRRGGEAPFDVIVAIHVLEHVGNPVEFLASLRPLLKPGGTVWIDVPDAAAYSSLDDLHLAHLYHFTRDTLALAARKAGYFVGRLERHRPPRHPPSVRVLLNLEPPASAAAPPPDERRAVFDRVRSVGRKTVYYRLRRTLPGRILAGGWKGIRRLLGGSEA
jgi:SAM-dependent methyltransferase